MTYIPKTFSRVCDPVDIAITMAAMSTGESLFVRSGSVTLGANLVPKADTFYYFDGVTIDTTGYYLGLSTARTRAMGFLKLTGAGEVTQRSLLISSGADVDWLDCEIQLVPTGAGLTKGVGGANFQIASSILYGTRHRHRITCRSITYAADSATQDVAVISQAGTNGYVNATLDTITNTSDTKNIGGVYIPWEYPVPVVGVTSEISVSGVTVVIAAGPGRGYGYIHASPGTKSLVAGHARGCNTNNVTWAGTVNTSGLVVG